MSTSKTNWVSRVADFMETGRVPDFRLYLSALPMVLIASIGVHALEPTPEKLLLYGFANLAALSVTAIAAYLLRSWLVGTRWKALVAVAIFGLVLGTVKGLATALVVVQLGLEPALLDALESRLVTPLLGAWFTLSFAGLKSSLINFEDARRRLILRKVRLLDSENKSAIPELDRFLKDAQLLIPSSTADAKQVSELIFDLVQHKLRPLIYDLWRSETAKHPSFSLRQLYRRATGQRPYPALLVASVHAVSAIGSVSPALGWPIALLLIFFVTFSVLKVTNLLRNRFNSLRRYPLFTLLASSAAIALIDSAAISFASGGQGVNWVLAAVSLWWVSNLTAVMGLIRAAVELNRENMTELLSLSEFQDVRGGADAAKVIENRELANRLHSKVQNHLLAQAIRLETASEVNLSQELEELRRTLSLVTEPEAEEEVGTQAIVNRWRGVVELDWQLDREPSRELLEAIDEAISNAYRHGRASQVQIMLSGSTLVVRDNGFGPVEGNIGVGSQYFTTIGTWSLKAGSQSGAVLRINLE